MGSDTTAGGIPATTYEDGERLEIYFRDVTVAIFGEDPSRIDCFATANREGPAVLAELGRFGSTLDERCIRDPHYCAAPDLEE